MAGLPVIGSGLYPIRSWISSRLFLAGAFGTVSPVSVKFPIKEMQVKFCVEFTRFNSIR